MALLLAAACAALLPQGKEPPARLRVLPRSEIIRGKDGRAWALGDTTKLLADLNANGPVLLDVDHGSVKGTDGKAAGWLSDFQLTAEGIEAAIEWTPIGEDLFSKKAYRYLSPTLHYDTAGATSDTLGTIRGLHSVGLVNTPNLDGLSALNSQTQDMTDAQIQALTAALTSAISNGFQALASQLPKTPEAPRPADVAANAIKVAINAVVDGAVASGKIAPASKDAYLAMAGANGENLAALQTLVNGLPVLVSTNAQGLGSAGTSSAAPAAFDSTDRMIVSQLGLTEEQYRASKGELAK